MLLQIADIRDQDELLGPVATEAMLSEAHDSLYLLAGQIGIAQDDIILTILVKRYLIAYTFWRTAVQKSYSAGGSAYRGGDAVDSYGSKVKYYADEVKQLEPKLTKETLTGAAPEQTFRAVRLNRG